MPDDNGLIERFYPADNERLKATYDELRRDLPVLIDQSGAGFVLERDLSQDETPITSALQGLNDFIVDIRDISSMPESDHRVLESLLEGGLIPMLVRIILDFAPLDPGTEPGRLGARAWARAATSLRHLSALTPMVTPALEIEPPSSPSSSSTSSEQFLDLRALFVSGVRDQIVSIIEALDASPIWRVIGAHGTPPKDLEFLLLSALNFFCLLLGPATRDELGLGRRVEHFSLILKITSKVRHILATSETDAVVCIQTTEVFTEALSEVIDFAAAPKDISTLTGFSAVDLVNHCIFIPTPREGSSGEDQGKVMVNIAQFNALHTIFAHSYERNKGVIAEVVTQTHFLSWLAALERRLLDPRFRRPWEGTVQEESLGMTHVVMMVLIRKLGQQVEKNTTEWAIQVTDTEFLLINEIFAARMAGHSAAVDDAADLARSIWDILKAGGPTLSDHRQRAISHFRLVYHRSRLYANDTHQTRIWKDAYRYAIGTAALKKEVPLEAREFCACLGCPSKKKPTMECTRCHVARYCGRECQTKDWKGRHKQRCKSA